jgi:DNA ligase-1
MLYSGIANVLRDISQAPRGQKADQTADFLTGLELEMLCPGVRLLLGELWPPWEDREMGVGPEALLAALKEVSEEDVPLLRERLGEMGLVAEAALQRKNQHPLLIEPLEAASVYERLRRISDMNGKDSEHRKDAVLRGLFLEATPLEGKYIARTALRNMLAGIGPQAMISALSSAFHCDQNKVQKAYNIMPEMGLIARAARLQELDGTVIQPKMPIKPMIIRPGKAVYRGAFLPKYAGLRVQVHKADGEIFVFTSRLRNITPSLSDLIQRLDGLTDDQIMDADLIGFRDERICSQTEMLWYINRRHRSLQNRISPALLAYDLIYLDGRDLTGLDYEERRRMLLTALGAPKNMPFQGISPAEERVLKNEDEVNDYLRQTRRAGGRGLVARGLEAPYLPGGYSDQDFIIGTGETVSALVVRAEFGHSKKGKLLTRYRMALRSQENLVPVGWVSGGLRQKDVSVLSDHLWRLALDQDEKGVNVRPMVVLTLKISGASLSKDGYRILQPKVEEIRFDAATEEVDELDRLEMI